LARAERVVYRVLASTPQPLVKAFATGLLVDHPLVDDLVNQVVQHVSNLLFAFLVFLTLHVDQLFDDFAQHLRDSCFTRTLVSLGSIPLGSTFLGRCCFR